MTTDRDALIDAAARALVDVESNGLCGKAWPGPCDMCDCGLDGMSAEDAARGESSARDRDRARHVLDAVLPLIADAIEDWRIQSERQAGSRQAGSMTAAG